VGDAFFFAFLPPAAFVALAFAAASAFSAGVLTVTFRGTNPYTFSFGLVLPSCDWKSVSSPARSGRDSWSASRSAATASPPF